MKRIIALCLVFLSIFSFALAEAPVQEDVQADELIADEIAESSEEAPQQMVSGFVIDNETFFALEERFRISEFSGTMSSVDLSETQTLVFNQEPVNRLLPTLAVTIADAEPFKEDANELASTVGSLIGVMQYLQDQFPDTFMFNNVMAEAYDGVGLGYLVAEPELWLWPESAGAVFIPVCFYENRRGTLIDDMYLLEVMAVEDGGLCYILYNDPQYVADYMEYVTVTADASAFQYALAFWYLKNYMLTATDIEHEQGAAGMLRVLNTLCFVRASSDTASQIVARVKRGEWYPVLSIAENGWYEIRLTDGTIGYISSNLVEFFPREMPDLQEPAETEGADAAEEGVESEEEVQAKVLETTQEQPLAPAETAEGSKSSN